MSVVVWVGMVAGVWVGVSSWCVEVEVEGCDALCEPPAVNGDIGFFDGFDGKLVGIAYGVIIFLSIVIQVIRCFCCAASIEAKYDEIVGDDMQSNAQERASHVERFNEQYK